MSEVSFIFCKHFLKGFIFMRQLNLNNSCKIETNIYKYECFWACLCMLLKAKTKKWFKFQLGFVICDLFLLSSWMDQNL